MISLSCRNGLIDGKKKKNNAEKLSKIVTLSCHVRLVHFSDELAPERGAAAASRGSADPPKRSTKCFVHG